MSDDLQRAELLLAARRPAAAAAAALRHLAGAFAPTRRALELTPDLAAAHELMAWLHRHAGEARRAIGCIERALWRWFPRVP
jgi:tetratricopeptide (TPR) repeat protein